MNAGTPQKFLGPRRDEKTEVTVRPNKFWSPKDDKTEAAIKAQCKEAGVDYDPPSVEEIDEYDRNATYRRRERLRKTCARRKGTPAKLSDERDKDAKRKREQRKNTPTKRSDEDREREAKRKREERQKEKDREEEEARERAIKRAELERSSQTMDEQEEDYGKYLLEIGVTPRVLGKFLAVREIVDITRHIIDYCKIGKVKVSTIITPGVARWHKILDTPANLQPAEGFQDLRVEGYKSISAEVGKNQKKLVHIEDDPATLQSMVLSDGSGICVKAIKCLHPATWEGRLKYLTNLVSVTERDESRVWSLMRGQYDFTVEEVFPRGKLSTPTDEDEGYVICGDSSTCETAWGFGIDQRLLKRFGLISSREICDIISDACASKYAQLLVQFVVSAFPTHDTVEYDSRVIMPNGESYGDFKRKYLQQHCKEEYADAKESSSTYEPNVWAQTELKSRERRDLSLTMQKKWPPPKLRPPNEDPIRKWVVPTSRYLNELVPYYKENHLIRDDRHCVISPFGMLSRRDKDRYPYFKRDSLDRVRIPDKSGERNVASFQVRVEEIFDIENGYIHRIEEGYEQEEPGFFQLTGRGGLPVVAYGDLRGGHHVIYPEEAFDAGYFSDEDEFGLSKTEDDYMFCIKMQTKLGEMSVEDLQALELHINGSKRADLSESSCKSSVDQSSLELFYKWNSISTLTDADCWVKLRVEIDINCIQRELGTTLSSEGLRLEQLSAGQTLVVRFTTISFTMNMLNRGGQLHAIALEDYNKSREGSIRLNTPLGLGIEGPIEGPETVSIIRAGPAISRQRCRTTREEEIDRLLKVSNSPPGKSNSAQLRFGVGQFVDCWVPSRRHNYGFLVNGRVVEHWSRVAPDIAGNPVWGGMVQHLSLRWAPYKVELTDARGMNFYVPLDKDMFIRASPTNSPMYLRHVKYDRETCSKCLDEQRELYWGPLANVDGPFAYLQRKGGWDTGLRRPIDFGLSNDST